MAYLFTITSQHTSEFISCSFEIQEKKIHDWLLKQSCCILDRLHL